MIIYGTEKFITEIQKAKELPLPFSASGNKEDSHWLSHVVILNRRKAVLLVHEETLLTLVIWPLKKQELSKVENIIRYAKQEYYDYLGLDWMKQMKIETEVEDRDIRFKRAENSIATKELEEIVDFLKWQVRDFEDNTIIQLTLMEKVNNRIVTYRDGSRDTPLNKWENYLSEKGLGEDIVFSPTIVELKVSLNLYEEKDVTRTIQVPLTYTFSQLHKVIQLAFMWDDYHLHRFTFEKPCGMSVQLVGDEESMTNSKGNKVVNFDDEVQLIEYIRPGDTFTYDYDFGDDWRHTVEVTSILPEVKLRTARLIDMEENPVPEDVGGPFGYARFKHIMQDSSHEEYSDLERWSDVYRHRLKNHTKDKINEWLNEV